jgi:hypothetical protein
MFAAGSPEPVGDRLYLELRWNHLSLRGRRRERRVDENAPYLQESRGMHEN